MIKMSDIKVSVIFYSLRTSLLAGIADCLKSNKTNYEVITAGPAPGENLQGFRHISTLVKPAQCYEICFRQARGETILWTTEYALYSSGSLDKAFQYWQSFGNYRIVIALKTLENNRDLTEMHRFFHGKPECPQMAPYGLMSREFLLDLGGYDKRFIGGQSENDLVMRVYEAGGDVVICPDAEVMIDHNTAHVSASVFADSHRHDRDVLESLWVHDGCLSKNRLKPFEKFNSNSIKEKNQGPEGNWNMQLNRLSRSLGMSLSEKKEKDPQKSNPLLLFKGGSASPKVSFVLLDWSSRDSFHSVKYLNEQTASRDSYEILWIEYYSMIPPDIAGMLEKDQARNRHPSLDQWIVLHMPYNIYYHKHFMYNIGLLAARGDIVCFTDSDAIYRPHFVESIIEAFYRQHNIVLHLDQVRNSSPRFYPFNYPSIDEITGEGCGNWLKGKTKGLKNPADPLHTRNYGACMCALREDLISIGGADEHKDFMGHVCGPYDMTFRLINAGKKEVWHQHEFTYHVWHPGTGGFGEYFGPHDGGYVSTTALEAKKTGRIYPLNENIVIRSIRLGLENEFSDKEMLKYCVQQSKIKEWFVK